MFELSEEQEAFRTVTGQENRIVAYDVAYEYHGQRYSTRLPEDPGPRLAVDVRPAGNGAVEPGAPAQYGAVPPATYGAVPPAYADTAPIVSSAPPPVTYASPPTAYRLRSRLLGRQRLARRPLARRWLARPLALRQ